MVTSSSRNTKRCVLYLRVSTSDQSVELQRRELLAYVQARQWEVIQIYDDTGQSGANNARPMYRQLLKDAKQRKFDMVLVWKLDRWARSLKEIIVSLQDLTDYGVEFCSLKDNLDLSTSTGRLMLHIIGSFAQFERDILVDRVRAGLANAKAKGKRLGRPVTRKDQQIINLRSKGFSYSQICKELNVSLGSVQRSLKALSKT
jgi:putative DNA-invertase from lambdoid prophage Rac